MDRQLTPEESLRLIEGMIGQAKRSFSRMSFYFLLWGVLLTLSMLTTYLLADLSPAIRQGAPWGVAGALGGLISWWYGFRQHANEDVQNPMDRIIHWVWGSFVITMMLVIITTTARGEDPGMLITLLTGIPTLLTGQIMRFRPLIAGGMLFWAAGLAMHFLPGMFAHTALYCGAMVFGYIVPGLLLKRQEDGLRTA